MRRGRAAVGWTRIGQNDFKAAIMSASASEPDLCASLWYAHEIAQIIEFKLKTAEAKRKFMSSIYLLAQKKRKQAKRRA